MAKKRMGRPKAGGRITFRYAIVATPEFRTWMEEFSEFIGKAEVSDVFREGIRCLAESKGFRMPPAR